MDLDVLFIGTAGSAPTARRALPATLLRRGGDRLLFDCGEGTQRQLLRSVGLIDLEEVFLTHYHADHFLGLPGMLKTFALRGREAPLAIYGPPGLRALFRALRPVMGRVGYELRLVDFDSGQLGYGPQGFTAAANRADWETPADLKPGTYTYFCRIHPFMRGAFRVRGKPDPGGPSGGRRASRAVVASRVLRMDRRRRVKLKLRCAGGSTACVGRVRLQGTRRGRRVTFGARPYRVRSGRTGRVAVRLSPAAARYVQRRRKVRVRVVMAARRASRAGRGRGLMLRAPARRAG